MAAVPASPAILVIAGAAGDLPARAVSRQFFPPVGQDPFLAELQKPASTGDRLLFWSVAAGPLVAGTGVPLLAAALSGRFDGWLFLAAPSLIAGLYALVWTRVFFAPGDSGPSAPADRLAAVPVGDAASRGEGALVLLEGRVAAVGPGPFPSDLTGKPVLWSSINLCTYRPGARGDVLEEHRAWERVVPFTIEDAGTRVEVDATDGLLRAAPHHLAARLDGPGGPRVRALLEAQKLVPRHGRASADEWALAEGDQVVVLGVVRGNTGSYRGAPVVIGSGPHDRLAVTGETREELVRVFDGGARASRLGYVIGGSLTALGVYAVVRMVLGG
jgi:hypothetical protein